MRETTGRPAAPRPDKQAVGPRVACVVVDSRAAAVLVEWDRRMQPNWSRYSWNTSVCNVGLAPILPSACVFVGATGRQGRAGCRKVTLKCQSPAPAGERIHRRQNDLSRAAIDRMIKMPSLPSV